MKKFLIILMLIIIIPICGIIMFLKFADFNKYKPQIEELALKYANLDVKINGDLKIGISLKPSIDISDVKIINPENKKNIAEIGSALVQFSIMPLLKKEIVVDTIQTAQTKIYYGDNEFLDVKDLVINMDSFVSPINITFDTNIKGIDIYGDGVISSFSDIKTSNFNTINLNVNVNALGYNLNYKGDVSGLQSKIITDGDFVLKYKDNIINGDVNVNLTTKIPDIKLSANSNKINLMDFSEKKQVSLNYLFSQANASEIIPNIVIPYEFLSMVDADIKLDIKDLIVNQDISLSDIKINTNIKNGLLKANIENIFAGEGKISGIILLDKNTQVLDVKLNGQDIIAQNLYKSIGIDKSSELYIREGGKTNFNINLFTKGTDTNQYIANSKGHIIAFVDESVVNIKSLDKLKGSIFSQILSNLKLNIVNKEMKMSCAVVRGDINSGIINFPKGIVFNSTDFYIVADGTTNINNDKLDLSIQPFSGKIKDANISSILGSLLKIKGTISNPSIGINQTEAVKNVVGALASGGIYNAGDMMLKSDGSPCYTALKGTIYSDYFEQDKSIKNNISQTYTNTKDAIKDLGNQAKGFIKGLLGDKNK